MASNADYFLKKTLGEDFFESLNKFELWKPGTRTTVDHEEIKTALMIVPRAIMALLIRELAPMEIGETKEIQLPVSAKPNHPMMRVTKHERDVYSGDIEESNKKLVDFKYRSIPGVGLVIMSAFELYDTSKLVEMPSEKPLESATKKVQELIDERMALYDLIGKVVDKKIMERDAIEQMFLRKLSEMSEQSQEPQKPEIETPHIEVLKSDEAVEAPKKKGSPLAKFLEDRKKKLRKNEFSIQMVKNETVRCADCGNDLIAGEIFTGCVCLGDDMERKLFVKKTEDGVKIRFSKGWDKENIEMLLEMLRRKRG